MASCTSSTTSSGSPCGACKLLRRKCASDCIFAPYFCSEQGAARFAAIHKVFGASNVSKLLSQIPVPDRCEAVVTIAYEAQARVQNPVYGCVAHVFALQQQVSYLQAQLMQLKVQMANNIVEPRVSGNAWNQNTVDQGLQQTAHSSYMQSTVSPQSSIDSADEDLFQYESCSSNKSMCQNDLGELHALALRMMRN